MRVAMIGTGYVGLISGACIADFGHEVVCVDKDAQRLLRLSVARFRFTNRACKICCIRTSNREGCRSQPRLKRRSVPPM